MNRPLKLNKRLTAAAEQVRPGAVAADIGTDHGYLACALVLSGRCRKVYASDLNHEPLERAEATIAAYGLKEAVIPLLSDGVQNLPAEEVTDFVIAGMGGDLIGSILMDERLYDPAKRFILQPMTKADVLRRTLYRNGFALTEESAVQDARFVYSVMTTVYTGNRIEIDEWFARTGRLAMAPFLGDNRLYLLHELERVEKQLSGLLRAEQSDRARVEQLRALRERFLKCLDLD